MHRKDLGLAALIASLFLVISLWVLYAPATPSQTETAHEAGEEHAEGGDEHGESGESAKADSVQLAPEVLKAQHIQWATAASQTLRSELRLPGKIAAVQDQLGHLSPRVSGVVTAVYKHLGDTVKKGEVLATLNSPELGALRLKYKQAQQLYTQAQRRYQLEKEWVSNSEALIQSLSQNRTITPHHQRLTQQAMGNERSQLTQAYTRYQVALRAYERELNLLKNQATTEVDVQQAEKQKADAQADYQGTVETLLQNHQLSLMTQEQAQLEAKTQWEIARQALTTLEVSPESSGTQYSLRSPMDGTLLEKHIAMGESLSAEARVFTLANLDTVWAEMMIPENNLSNIRLGSPITVYAQASEAKTTGTVSHIQSAVEASSQTVEAHAEIANPKGLWKPDMFVTVALQSTGVKVPLAVPRAALQPFENNWVVFVPGSHENTLKAQVVRTGRESQDWVEITAGLKAGQKYIAKNAFLVKAELEKSSASHSH